MNALERDLDRRESAYRTV